jgi:hypothetical protein
MQVDLAVQGVCHQSGFSAVKRYAGFVAAGFNAENIHVRRMIARFWK